MNAGLCTSCKHSKMITSSRASQFTMCMLSQSDARFPKYPRLPVIVCAGYEDEAFRKGQAREAADPGLN